MGFLDRFKKQKEQEVEKAAPVVSRAKEKETTTEKTPAPAKAAKSALDAKKPSKAKAKMKEDVVGVLIRPVVTEKSAILASHGQYVFAVRDDANRVAVSHAVKMMYGVQPVAVNIQNIRAQSVRFGRRSGTRKAWKKAMVRLPKGTSLDVYAGV